MKYKKKNKIRNNKGFTIIESLVYIFLTTIILVEGISLYISIYKSYLETQLLTIKCNNYQNFYINLDNIIAEGNIEKIVANSDNIIFSKDNKAENINKIIKAFDGKIVVKYTKYSSSETINYMLKDIDKLEVKAKKNLIYLIIYDKEGKEFIKCI